MKNQIISSTGIRFLRPTILIDSIIKIEVNLPGWWWSLSQKKDKVTISMAPAENCPNQQDVIFSKTKEGDAGFINTFNLSDHSYSEDKFLLWLDGIVKAIRSFEFLKIDSALKSIDSNKTWYRTQSAQNLLNLKEAYSAFLQKLEVFEKKDHILKEIYLGSCDLSADCSLRGNRSDGTEFDISIDLHGHDESISDSLKDCVTELINDILTFLSEKKGNDYVNLRNRAYT